MRYSFLYLLSILSFLFLGACGPAVDYKPAHQLVPHNIQKIALRHVINRTQQFGLEDKLTAYIRDEFLRNGYYEIVPEKDAQGIVQVTITLYVVVPIQYDSSLIPTAFKMRVNTDLKLIDAKTNRTVFDQPNLQAVETYTINTLPGGMTEEMARLAVWDMLSRLIVRRVVKGWGSATGVTWRHIQADTKSSLPPAKEQGPATSVFGSEFY